MTTRRLALDLVQPLVAAMVALGGCSLATDLDSLTANRQQVDASAATAPADALPVVDKPASPDAGTVASSPDAQRGHDPAPISVDANSFDDNPSEDGMAGTVEDAPADDASGPDVAPPFDSGLYDHDGRSGDPTPGNADAAAAADGLTGGDRAVDGGAGGDATPDAKLMCPRLPSHNATLYLLDDASATTSCGYARASLSGDVASVDTTTFAESASCGACLRVETAAATIVAEVVALGPGATKGNPTGVAVNRAALSKLVPDGSTFVEQGVAWRFVPCPLPSSTGTGMTFQFQEGSSANYAALLIQRHRFRLASVEYRSNGSYRSLMRSSYNYWIAAAGMGAGPFTLRITDVHGNSVEQAGVPLKPGVAFEGQAQFPECSNN